jgi:polar amino acid transport system permease protein
MSSGTLAKVPAAPEIPEPADAPRIVPQRRYGQWTATVAVLALLGFAVNSVLRNEAFQWDVVADYFTSDSVLRGLWLTLWLTAVVMRPRHPARGLPAVRQPRAAGGRLGVRVAVPVHPDPGAAAAVVQHRRAVLGVKTVNLLSPVAVAVVGLTLHEAAYAAEVVRGGILSVDHGQVEAAHALGLSRWRRWWRIVLPQAMRAIVPPAGNMLIGTLKGTSIVSVIAVDDLLFSAQLIHHRTYQVIPLLMVATLWYAVITSLLGIGQHYVEKHYARGTEHAR